MTSQALRMHNEPISHFNPENIGLIDRLLRIAAAALLIGQILLWRDPQVVPPVMQGYLVLLGLYPAFTAIIGWDPLYALADVRTCGRAPYSVCGSLTDQFRAAAQGLRRGAMSKVLPFRMPRPAQGVTARAEAANDSGKQDRAA